jgi:fucose permease
MSIASAGLLVLYVAHRDIADATSAPVMADTAEGRDATVLVAALLAVFFFYVAAEASVGAWTFSLLTESRGVADTVGRVFVSMFWAGLTLGRFGLGWLGHHVPLRSLLRWSVAGAGVGVGVLWIDPFPGADLIALPLIGVAMAGVFPALVLLTPGWLGSGRTARIVGYQLAASSLGAVTAAAFTRELVGARGEAAIGAALATAATGLVVSFVVLDRLAPRTRVGTTPGAAV